MEVLGIYLLNVNYFFYSLRISVVRDYLYLLRNFYSSLV